MCDVACQLQPVSEDFSEVILVKGVFALNTHGEEVLRGGGRELLESAVLLLM